jgi:hypothetical protein
MELFSGRDGSDRLFECPRNRRGVDRSKCGHLEFSIDLRYGSSIRISASRELSSLLEDRNRILSYLLRFISEASQIGGFLPLQSEYFGGEEKSTLRERPLTRMEIAAESLRLFPWRCCEGNRPTGKIIEKSDRKVR